MKNVKDESFDHKQEAAKLYNELKKTQPIIANLQEQNVKFLTFARMLTWYLFHCRGRWSKS